LVFRLGALTSSILLATGFVACRSGALDSTTQAPATFPGSKAGNGIIAPAQSPVAAQPPPTMIGGTKDFSPNRFIQGITPAAQFTSDLDIPVQPSSFMPTRPSRSEK
jgi:hypothetical protein